MTAPTETPHATSRAGERGAPGVEPRRRSRRHGVRPDWGYAAIWLIFLFIPLFFVVTEPGSVPLRVYGVGTLVLFGAAYVTAFRTPTVLPVAAVLKNELAWLGLLVLIALATIPAQGPAVLYLGTYLVAFAVFRLPVRVAVGTVAAVYVLVFASLLVLDGSAQSPVIAITLGGATAAMVGIRFFTSREDAEIGLRQEMAVVRERERVARDVHDVLGHSLTVVAIKAELAERMLDIDPERTRTELRDILRLSREALGEVRGTVGQLRTADLGSELVSARTALAAAGIDADVPDDLPVRDPSRRQLFAWVVREGTTNVVRHSRAAHCRIACADGALVIEDDGAGCGDRGASGPSGNGLRGLRRRLEEADGALLIGPAAEGENPGTRLEARLP